MILLLLFFLVGADSHERGVLTLAHFHPVPPFFALEAASKADYFVRLESKLNYTSGFQTDTTHALCPTASGGAELHLPSCLLQRGYSYAVFIGDSITREAGWAFSRLAASTEDDNCQQMGAPHERWAETKGDPSFNCDIAPRGPGGPAICDAAAQEAHRGTNNDGVSARLCSVKSSGASVNSLPPCHRIAFSGIGYDRDSKLLGIVQDCCAPGRFFMHFHDWDFDTENVHETVLRYRASCRCNGLIYMSLSGLHLLINANPATQSPPEPWTYPYGREAGVRMLLDSVVGRTALERNTAQQHQTFFLASTPRPHNDVLTLAPIKFDWKSFAQFRTTRLWAEQDRRLAKEYSIHYVPYYEASSAFRGLQCDGLHFGNSWEEVAGCKGFTVVTDLIMNHALGQICNPNGPSVHIGEVRSDCSWQSD